MGNTVLFANIDNIANIENDVTNDVEEFYDDDNYNLENEQELKKLKKYIYKITRIDQKMNNS